MTTHWLMRSIYFGLTAAMTFGCDGAARPAYVARDSVGIAIIEKGSLETWTLSETPDVNIGTMDGDPSYVFHQIVAAAILAPGRIAVADQGSKTVRLYQDGMVVRVLGRPGQGPFEFSRLDLLRLVNDSLLVYDAGHARVSVFSVNGDPLREFRIGPGVNVESIDSRGRLLGITARPMSEYRTSGTVENLAAVVRLSGSGDRQDSLVVVPYSERLVQTDGRSTAAFALPFGRFGLIVPWRDGFCYTYGYLVEVRCFDAVGQLETITRLTSSPRELSTSQKTDFANWFSSFVQDEDTRSAVRDRFLGQWSYPQYSPAVATLMNDRLGCTWIETYRRPRLGSDDWYSKEAQGTGRWIVLNESRVPIAEVNTALPFSPLDIAEDLVVGVWRDELGVQSLRAFRLLRSSSARATSCM